MLRAGSEDLLSRVNAAPVALSTTLTELFGSAADIYSCFTKVTDHVSNLGTV